MLRLQLFVNAAIEQKSKYNYSENHDHPLYSQIVDYTAERLMELGDGSEVMNETEKMASTICINIILLTIDEFKIESSIMIQDIARYVAYEIVKYYIKAKTK
jgi:hypothetical protein